MKKSTVIILLFIAFVTFIVLLPNPKQFDGLKGQYSILTFQHNYNSIDIEQYPILLIDNLSSGLNIGNLFNKRSGKNSIMSADYDFENSKGEIKMILSNSHPKFLDGEYLVRIDTIEFNRKFQTFRMIFESETVLIVGEKSTTYINF